MEPPTRIEVAPEQVVTDLSYLVVHPADMDPSKLQSLDDRLKDVLREFAAGNEGCQAGLPSTAFVPAQVTSLIQLSVPGENEPRQMWLLRTASDCFFGIECARCITLTPDQVAQLPAEELTGIDTGAPCFWFPHPLQTHAVVVFNTPSTEQSTPRVQA